MKRLTKEEFIRRASEIHNEKYDYSQVEYINEKSKVKIFCPLHGAFEQRPYNHSKGEGCPNCKLTYVGMILRSTKEKFVEQACKIHNNFYDYSKVIYDGNKKKVKIICPAHGEFLQTPNNHLMGQTCPECAQLVIASKNRKTTDEFIEDAHKVHGNKYDYSNVKYIHKDVKVLINCYIHGIFEQCPHNHLHGAGCPKCQFSHGEQQIVMTLDNLNINYQCQKKFNCCRSLKKRMLRFDFYIPEKNLLIEYDGPQHYGHLRIGKYTLNSEEYKTLKINDNIKDNYAKNNGIILLRIPYWEKNIERILTPYLL